MGGKNLFQSISLYKTLNITAHRATISLFILYGCETQSLTANEERVSEMSPVKMLWSISGNNKSEIEAMQNSL
jgi:hypothetical protein